VVLVSRVSTFGPYSFQGAASTLTYHSDVERTTLAWFDRAGARLETVASGVRMEHPALSPDGRIVVERAEESGGEDLWLFDQRGASQRLTSGTHDVSDAVWSPDGGRLVFSRGIGRALFELEPNGAERPLLELGSERDKGYATDWSQDGALILYTAFDGTTFSDVWMLPLSTPARPEALVRTPFHEHQARFSPNGRLIAYASDEGGFPQVYVMAMPPAVGKWPVTTDGGAQPTWRRDGRELFYVDLTGMLMSVAVETGSTFEASDPRPLFQLSLTDSPFFYVRNDYAVSPDGQRLLVASVDPADAAKLHVIVDWEAMLEP
jgi:Tol biopolymer transport system component